MTCIVGIAQDGKVYMGGDSAAVADRHYLNHVKTPKVFKNGAYLIGYTSSFRMGQLLQYACLPEPPSEDLNRFMVTSFVSCVRDILSRGGYLKRENDRESSGSFLVGVEGELFHFDDDNQVSQYLKDYGAVGCGESVALGSLYTTDRDPTYTPAARIFMALGATQEFVTGVREPFYVYES